MEGGGRFSWRRTTRSEVLARWILFYQCLSLIAGSSGKFILSRSLSKRGDSEARRLLHNAALAASRTEAWKGFYQAQRELGYSTTQVLVMLARKLARVVFALLKGQTEYQPKVG
nr:transposase [Pseudomonas salomonii]